MPYLILVGVDHEVEAEQLEAVLEGEELLSVLREFVEQCLADRLHLLEDGSRERERRELDVLGCAVVVGVLHVVAFVGDVREVVSCGWKEGGRGGEGRGQ